MIVLCIDAWIARIWVGFCTARGELNAKQYIDAIQPDIIISSGGAMVTFRGKQIYTCLLTVQETRTLITRGFELTGGQCKISVDTLTGHYWNAKADSAVQYPGWGKHYYDDFQNFTQQALKISMELYDRHQAQQIARSITDCDWVKFSDCDWYKFSKAGTTKAVAIQNLSRLLPIPLESIIAFGDDYSDIEMLKICGKGISVENAIPEVKAVADERTASNDADGVAVYVERMMKRFHQEREDNNELC